MASSNDQRIQPHLMAMPTTLNHISIAVNKEQEEQDQTFGNYINYIPNHFNGSWSHTQSLAPGYRFCPLDGELIVHYLRKKVNNEALPHNGIRDVTLYQHNPEYLTALYPALGDKKWYFFTPRDRKYPNGFRPNRATGNGYWKATGADKPVDYKDKVVGLRKVLVFYEGKPKPGKGIKTNWIMHEFRVKGPPRIKENQHDMKLDDWVLCRIYKKENGKEGEVRKGKMGGVQAEHKPVPVPVSVSVPSLAATLLEGSVNDSNLVGESLKYDEYIQSPQHPKLAQSIDEFHPYRDIFAASDPQPTLVSIAWPAAAARAPPVHLDNKYFQEEFDDLDDFDSDGLFAQNPNSAGQNSYNVLV